MEFNNLADTMEFIRKLYTCEISMFDEFGDEWTDEYCDFYNSEDDLINNPGFFRVESIPDLMSLFDDTLNYDELMSVLVDLVINISCFYGSEGLNKLFESLVNVKDKGKMYGKIELLGRLIVKHYEELKIALSTSTNEAKQSIKDILPYLKAKDLQDKKEELLNLLY